MRGDKLNYQRFFLKNGLEVVMVERPEKYTASLAGNAKAGSAYEGKRLSGASHFVEHLLFRGNKKFKTSGAVDEEQERLGLSHGASTNYDFVRYHASFPPWELESALEFVGHALFESNLDEAEIKKERQIMLEEEKLREDNLSVRSWDLALETRLKDKNHPLALPSEGLAENIKVIAGKNLRKFYQTHFNPANFLCVIGGNFKGKDGQKIVEKVLGKFPPSEKIKKIEFKTSDFSSFQIASETKEVEKTYLYFTIPAFSHDRPLKERLALNLLLRIFRRIRLDKRLYQEKGLSYDWGAGWSVPAHPIGIFWTYSSCEPKNLSEIIKIFFEEIKKLKEKRVLRYELERARDYLNKIQSMDFDYLSGAVEWFLEDFWFYQRFYSPEEIIKARNKLSEDLLLKTVQEIIDFKKLNVTVLGPTTQKEVERMVKRELEKL